MNRKKIMIILLSCIVITIVIKSRKMDSNTTAASGTYPNPSGKNRGLKNNNPLNIRKSSDKFQGEIQPSGDPAFKQFTSMAYGYRAAFKILQNYLRNGHNTIEKIVKRWAPASDGNNTASYIRNVANRSGIAQNALISGKDQLIRVVQAMAQSEVGITPTITELNQAWLLI